MQRKFSNQRSANENCVKELLLAVTLCNWPLLSDLKALMHCGRNSTEFLEQCNIGVELEQIVSAGSLGGSPVHVQRYDSHKDGLGAGPAAICCAAI
jgi:hypothetical protein